MFRNFHSTAINLIRLVSTKASKQPRFSSQLAVQLNQKVIMSNVEMIWQWSMTNLNSNGEIPFYNKFDPTKNPQRISPINLDWKNRYRPRRKRIVNKIFFPLTFTNLYL